MIKIEELEPREVFSYFQSICNIPHGSYHEKELSDYCVAFAKERGLSVTQDSIFNVVIVKEATKGYELEEPIIIQGHLDMVCEKKEEFDFNFETEGLKLETDGKYLYANGTTLGGDDGIAVAYALAILASDSIQHPRLEVVFTVSEEVGMEGAAGIELSMLRGKRLLNIDSEEEGIMLSSCAGGVRAYCEIPVLYEKSTGQRIKITLRGLTGGHSGVEIHKWRANANLLMGRMLLQLQKEVTYGIISLSGGQKDNAIPRECTVEILVEQEDVSLVQKLIQQFSKIYQHEYKMTDPEMEVELVCLSEWEGSVLSKSSWNKTLGFLTSTPNGIQMMSMEIEGLVETSLNLGIMELGMEHILFTYAVRSAKKSAKEALCDKLTFLTNLFEGNIRMTGNYPAWEYKADSVFREKMCAVYEEMYGVRPKVEAVHAGLECGLLSEKIEGLDCVSIGPNMSGIHTTEEMLDIASVKRVWEYLLRLLETKETE